MIYCIYFLSRTFKFVIDPLLHDLLELFYFAVLVLYEELMPSSLLNYISPPSLLSPLSNVFEINNPPGWLNRGFTVTVELI